MDYMLKKFRDEVGSILKPLGFKLKNGKYYVRITDERVYQTLTLFRRTGACHIRYLSAPLCSGEGLYLTNGRDYEKMWENYTREEALYDKIVSEMARVVRDCLLPYFERTRTFEGAYREECKIEWAVGGCYFSFYKAKKGEYQAMIDWMGWLIAKHETAVENNVASFRKSGFQSEEEIQSYIERSDKELEHKKEMRDFFAESSHEAIQKYLEENEEGVMRSAKWKL